MLAFPCSKTIRTGAGAEPRKRTCCRVVLAWSWLHLLQELELSDPTRSGSLQTLLPSVADAGGGFGLKTVEVAVGIDGKGHVGFLGIGVEVGAQATIKLTFNR